MPATPIRTPSTYVASTAAAYADSEGAAVLVSNATPLPVTQAFADVTPLTGTTSTSGQVGPFQPGAGRPFSLVLSGTWAGTVRLLRSTDGGSTRLPVTISGQAWAQFTGNCCEPVWEESEAGAAFYLDIALTSGSLAYRLAQ